MRRRVVSLLLLLAGCGAASAAAGGCARARVVTIAAEPPDAIIRVDGRDRGRGPITETFAFSGDVVAHTVNVRRPGYDDRVVTITPESAEAMTVRLRPTSRKITIRARPADAVVKLDGRTLPTDASGEVTVPVEFPVDASGAWATHVVTAEHPNFETFSQTLTYDGRETEVLADLQAVRKTFSIETTPPGAKIYINDEYFGLGPVKRENVAFPVDPSTGRFVTLKVRVEQPGFETRHEEVSWDGGRENYEWTLEPQTKDVRIITDPPDATVTFGGVDVPLDATGAHVRRQAFPLNAKGRAKAFEVVVSKKADDREWETRKEVVSWDDGRTEYEIKLKEILTRPVPMLRVRTEPGEGGWTVAGERSTPLAMRDTGEGPDAPAPVQVTKLAPDAMLDTVAASPDGTQVLFTVLETPGGVGAATTAGGELRSRLFTQRTDAPGGEPVPLTDGRSLEVMPAFTPDGSQVVFASNRAGPRLSIWMIAASAEAGGGPEQLTASADAHDLWPSVDASPKPRLFYQSMINRRPESRLFVTTIGAVGRRDLANAGGTQPRVGPNADEVVFAAAVSPGGKRDIFRMSDDGKGTVNLTNTPDADEFDPAWSGDGRRVAYASDAARSEEQPDNYDVFVLDVTEPGAGPTRVTTNGSWDDSPAWDARGRAIYFRSNRGGAWNVWRIDVK